MKIDGKVFLVTGAGSGMGRELTLQLVDKGAKVAAIDIDLSALKETLRLAGPQVEIFPLDVRDLDEIELLPDRIESKFGGIDGLINNAGIIQPFVRVNELTLEQAKKVMEVNFYGPLSLIKAFLPHLLKKSEAHILNVSSMGAYAPVPGQSVYGASKAAIKLLTEGLRSELTGTSVGVTIVFPGAIDTNITKNSGIDLPVSGSDAPEFPMTSSKDAAAAMIRAIEKNSPRLCIGKDAKTMDLLTRLNPIFAAKLIYKQMASLLK